MIDGPPKVMLDTVDADEDLIDVPTPKGIRPLADPLSAYLRGEHRSEMVPPETDSLVTDINAALVENIFDLAQRKRVSNIHHHRQADHLRRTVEATERISHPATLSGGVSRLKTDCSDNALQKAMVEIGPQFWQSAEGAAGGLGQFRLAGDFG